MIGFCAVCGEKVEVLGQPGPNDPNGFVTIQLAQLMHITERHPVEMKRISAFSLNVSLFFAGLTLRVSSPAFSENRESVRRFLADGIGSATYSELARQLVMAQSSMPPDQGIVQD